MYFVILIQQVMIVIMYRRFYLLQSDMHTLYLGLVKQITLLNNLIAKR